MMIMIQTFGNQRDANEKENLDGHHFLTGLFRGLVIDFCSLVLFLFLIHWYLYEKR